MYVFGHWNAHECNLTNDGKEQPKTRWKKNSPGIIAYANFWHRRASVASLTHTHAYNIYHTSTWNALDSTMHRDGIGRLNFANCAYRPFDATTVMYEILWAKRKRYRMQFHGCVCVRVCVAEFDDEKGNQIYIMKCSHTKANLWCGIICEWTFSAYMDARDSQRCGYWLFFFSSAEFNLILGQQIFETNKKEKRW